MVKVEERNRSRSGEKCDTIACHFQGWPFQAVKMSICHTVLHSLTFSHILILYWTIPRVTPANRPTFSVDSSEITFENHVKCIFKTLPVVS